MELRRRIAVAVAVALVFTGSAKAALEVRVSVVPAKPKAGKRAVIQVRPYWTRVRADGTCCRLEPADVGYPFRIEAVSPRGRVVRLPVRRTRNRYVWSGAFVFRGAGRWTLREPHWGPGYSTQYGARPRIRVVVTH